MAKHRKEDGIRAIQSLLIDWLAEQRETGADTTNASYLDFKHWAASRGFGHYWEFRSTMGADYEAELLFDRETNQVWKR